MSGFLPTAALPVAAPVAAPAAATPTPSGGGGLSSLFSGAVLPQQPTSSDTSTQYPQWLQQFTYNLAQAGQDLAAQPYSPYPGPKIAVPSDATKQAWDLAQGNIGNYQGALNQAYAQNAAGSAPLSPDTINQYMNPYIGNVVGALQSASNTNFTKNTLPGIQSQFVSAGQVASPQQRQADNDAAYQSKQALDQATAGALSGAYQSASDTALKQRSQQLQGSAQSAQLGALNQQLGGFDVGQIAASGQGQDTFNQSNLNAGLNDFYAQQQWPYQNLAYASNILRGQPIASNTQTVGLAPATTQSYSPSPLQSFIGTTLGAGSLFGGNRGASSGTTGALSGFKAGGSVRHGAKRREPMLRAA